MRNTYSIDAIEYFNAFPTHDIIARYYQRSRKMQLLTVLNETNDLLSGLSLALGFFDGVHLGHQDVIMSAVNAAKEHGLKSAVITFSQSPMCYLSGKMQECITTRSEKYRILEKLGINFVVELDFPSVRYMTAVEYLSDVLVKRFSPKFISAGFSHRFGVNNTGNIQLLADNQRKFSYTFFPIAERKLDGQTISSTTIREYIRSGDVVSAVKMLGHNFSISGCTQNTTVSEIFYPSEIVHLQPGSYFVNVLRAGKILFQCIADLDSNRILHLRPKEPINGPIESIEFIRPCCEM